VCKTIKERCAKGPAAADAGHNLLGARPKTADHEKKASTPAPTTTWSNRPRPDDLTSSHPLALVDLGSIPASAEEKHPRRRRLARHPQLIADALNPPASP